MFDLVDGLPVHALIVHGVVVLLPLAVLGTWAIAVVPGWRTTYGWLLVGITGAATALIPVATQSGERLQDRVGDPGEHADLGGQLLWFALPLLTLVLALVLLGDATERASLPGSAHWAPGRVLVVAVAGLACLAAAANAVQVYRVGESGTRAVWDERIS